jgi:hypothetical protein
MTRTRWGFLLTGVVGLGALGLLGLGASGQGPTRPARMVFVQPGPAPAWSQGIARVDEALGQAELRRAIYEWRRVYGAAFRNGRSDGLIAVGDRALRIAERSAGSGYFRREARALYLHAALRARAERSKETMLGIAERFERLGDTTRAGQVRRLAAGA